VGESSSYRSRKCGSSESVGISASMKILLIGKTGQLGGAILKVPGSHVLVAPDRPELDITSREQIHAAMARHRPDVVINTAAFHNVPLCEDRFEDAFRVNCAAVRDLARACESAGSLFVTFSTDYVFDGLRGTPYTEDDRPAPLQIYGLSKLSGEFYALSAAPSRSVVIRTCGLYGISGARSKGGNFVDNRLRDAQKVRVLEMTCEQSVSPTFTGDLAPAVMALIRNPRLSSGIYHLVNEGGCTWYEFTKAIFETTGVDIEVRPIDRGGRTGEMRRPLYSVLANTKAKRMGIALPHWKVGLSNYLRERSGNYRPGPSA